MKIAIVRGKYLNKYEMQYYEPLVKRHEIVAFGSLQPLHDQFSFPVVKFPSPMDLPNFPYKMPILNRLFIDAQYLCGLETKIKGFDCAHCAETYMHFTRQCLNAKKKGFVKKVIATVSENIPFNNEGIWGRKRFKKRAIKELDAIIAISEKAKRALELEGAGPEKITVIGHHVDCSKFKPSLNQFKGPRVKKFNILFVGRLEKEKGVYEVIGAAKEVLNDLRFKNFDLRVTLIGEGSEKKRLLELELKMGIKDKITHKTVLYEKMPEEYQKADIFIAPSKPNKYWQEQFSMVLLEAQASGLPIITTTSGAIPENVGKAAILISPGDDQALAEAIKKLILNRRLCQDLGEKARQRAVKNFDIQIGAKKLEAIYENLF